MKTPFTVYDLHGKSIGLAESFGEARKLHNAWLEKNRPDIFPLYGGVATGEENFGAMLLIEQNDTQ